MLQSVIDLNSISAHRYFVGFVKSGWKDDYKDKLFKESLKLDEKNNQFSNCPLSSLRLTRDYYFKHASLSLIEKFIFRIRISHQISYIQA
jgi:hypothetical protein